MSVERTQVARKNIHSLIINCHRCDTEQEFASKCVCCDVALPPAVICFSVVGSGELKRFVWHVENADAVSIDVIGPVAPKGSFVACCKNEIYTLEARGEGGVLEATACVEKGHPFVVKERNAAEPSAGELVLHEVPKAKSSTFFKGLMIGNVSVVVLATVLIALFGDRTVLMWFLRMYDSHTAEHATAVMAASHQDSVPTAHATAARQLGPSPAAPGHSEQGEGPKGQAGHRDAANQIEGGREETPISREGHGVRSRMSTGGDTLSQIHVGERSNQIEPSLEGVDLKLHIGQHMVGDGASIPVGVLRAIHPVVTVHIGTRQHFAKPTLTLFNNLQPLKSIQIKTLKRGTSFEWSISEDLKIGLYSVRVSDGNEIKAALTFVVVD